MAAILPCPPQFRGQVLTAAQIAQWAQQSGFTGKDLQISVAVALAESSGRIDATNHDSNGTTDYGVWQINSVHAALFEQYPQWWSVENADMAHSVFTGSGWNAWTTFTSGAYKSHMPDAGAAAQNPSTGNQGTAPVNTSIGNALKGIAQAVFKSAAWVTDPHNWVRVAMVSVGGALVIGAVLKISEPVTEPVIGAAVGVAGKVK